MKRRMQKGIGVPTAILMCSLLLVVSFGVTSSIIVSNSLARVAASKDNNEIIFKQTTAAFIRGGKDFTADSISDDTFDWKVLFNGTKEDEIHALVAERNNQLRFYAIYNFETDDLLAYQSSHFNTSIVDGVTYLAGLIRYTPGGNA